MLVTSFSPTRIEAQQKALESWRKYNKHILAVQCVGEDFAKDFKPDQIIWVPPNKNWSKRTPSITHVFSAVQAPFIYLNSDIELEMDNLSWWEPEPNVLKIGLRTDYCPQFTQLNKYGIDVFQISPEMMEHLDNHIWALGVPGWDYWVVWKLIQCGYQVAIQREDILHEAHHEQWNHLDYRRCGKLLEFEFDIPIQDISDKLQQLTERTHLVKKRFK